MGIKQETKQFIKQHPSMFKIVRKVLGKRSTISNTPFYSMGETFQMLIQSLEQKIPNDFDCIIGVPRAGLMFANIIASMYGCPLATPEGFIRGEVWFACECQLPKEYKKVLVIEDSVCTGKQILSVIERLADFNPEMEIKTASLFVKTGYNVPLDYVLLEHDRWTIGEWNLLTSLGFIGRLGVDFDGVLCEDCKPNVDDDGVLYREFLNNAKPLLIPRFEIDAVITSRLEKYRPETEEWLKNHGVRYKELIMLDMPIPEKRTLDVSARHKAQAIKQANLEWYWESNQSEAEQIHKNAHVPVLCVSQMRLFGDPRKSIKPKTEQNTTALFTRQEPEVDVAIAQ